MSGPAGLPTWTPQQMAEAMLDHEAKADRAGWDAPPRPFLMVTSGAGLRTHPADLDMRRWRTTTRAYLALEHFGRQPYRGSPTLRRRIAAVGWQHEAWTVQVHERDVAARDQMMAAAGDRQLYRHPDRIETRTVQAVDRHGHVYFIARERDGLPEVWTGLPGDATHRLLDGAMIDALRAYAAVVFGW